MSPESEKYFKSAISAKKAELTSAIDDIHSTLTNITNLSKPRISEEIFIKEILPYACGDIESSNDNDEFRNRYINMFGGLNIAVDIVGKSGELLFTIPPIVTTEFLTVTRSDDSVSYGELVRYGALLGARTSHAQANYLSSSLGQKGDEIVQQQRLFGSQLGFDAWVAIFKRYNKKHALSKMLSTASETGNIPKTSSSDSDDDLVYEFD